MAPDTLQDDPLHAEIERLAYERDVARREAEHYRKAWAEAQVKLDTRPVNHVSLIERLRYEAQWACVSMSYKTQTHHGWLFHEAADELTRYQQALRSIARNTCCAPCQEAALVAQEALREPHA